MNKIILSLIVIVSLALSHSLQAAGPLNEFLGISENEETPALIPGFPLVLKGRPIDSFLRALGKEIGIVTSTILEPAKTKPETEKTKIITKKRKTPAPIIKPSFFRIKLKDQEA